MVISINKYHTVFEQILMLKKMNYIIYTAINYSIKTPIYVFCIIIFGILPL